MRKFSTWLIVTACLSAMAFGAQVQSNFSNLVQSWGQGLHMSVYVNSEIMPIADVQKTISAIAGVKSVQIISSEESFKSFQNQMASFGSISLNAEDIIRSIPASLLVEINKDSVEGSRYEELQRIAIQLQNVMGVESVDFGQNWVQRFSELVIGFQYLGLILGILIFATAASVIFNSIHLLVLEKRSEIEILELLGADSRFIQMPFIKQGLWMGLLSALMAVGINFGLFTALKMAMSQHSILLSLAHQVQNVSWTLALVILGLGSILGTASAFICVRRINTGWLAAGH